MDGRSRHNANPKHNDDGDDAEAGPTMTTMAVRVVMRVVMMRNKDWNRTICLTRDEERWRPDWLCHLL